MIFSFLIRLFAGVAISFILEALFGSSRDYSQEGLLVGVSVGLITGLMGGFYLRYLVSRDAGDGSAIEGLGLFLGVCIGYPLSKVVLNGAPATYGLSMLVTDCVMLLAFYQSAVKKRRKQSSTPEEKS
jgi:hypothetical protein